MSKVAIRPARYGKKDTYASKADSPEGENIEGVISVSYISKIQGSFIYPVYLALFAYNKCNKDWGIPAMRQLRPNLRKMSLERRERYTQGEWVYEIWACKSAYNDNDIVRDVRRALQITFEMNDDWGYWEMKK